MRPVPRPIPARSAEEDAQTLFTSFHPFPEWMENILGRTGAFALSAIITALMVLWALTALVPTGWMHEAAVGVLWTAFIVWFVLLFAYLISRVVFGRRKAELFREYEPRAARILWGQE